MADKGKCSEKPPRRGPMSVKVKGYTREDGTKVDRSGLWRGNFQYSYGGVAKLRASGNM